MMKFRRGKQKRGLGGAEAPRQHHEGAPQDPPPPPPAAGGPEAGEGAGGAPSSSASASAERTPRSKSLRKWAMGNGRDDGGDNDVATAGGGGRRQETAGDPYADYFEALAPPSTQLSASPSDGASPGDESLPDGSGSVVSPQHYPGGAASGPAAAAAAAPAAAEAPQKRLVAALTRPKSLLLGGRQSSAPTTNTEMGHAQVGGSILSPGLSSAASGSTGGSGLRSNDAAAAHAGPATSPGRGGSSAGVPFVGSPTSPAGVGLLGRSGTPERLSRSRRAATSSSAPAVAGGRRIIPGLGRTSWHDDGDDRSGFFLSEPSMSGEDTTDNTGSASALDDDGTDASSTSDLRGIDVAIGGWKQTIGDARSPPPPPILGGQLVNSPLTPAYLHSPALSSPGATSLSSGGMSPYHPVGGGRVAYHSHLIDENELNEMMIPNLKGDGRSRFSRGLDSSGGETSSMGENSDGAAPGEGGARKRLVVQLREDGAVGVLNVASGTSEDDDAEGREGAGAMGSSSSEQERARQQPLGSAAQQTPTPGKGKLGGGGRSGANFFTPDSDGASSGVHHFLTPPSTGGSDAPVTNARGDKEGGDHVDNQSSSYIGTVGEGSSSADAQTRAQADDFIGSLRDLSVGSIRAARSDEQSYGANTTDTDTKTGPSEEIRTGKLNRDPSAAVHRRQDIAGGSYVIPLGTPTRLGAQSSTSSITMNTQFTHDASTLAMTMSADEADLSRTSVAKAPTHELPETAEKEDGSSHQADMSVLADDEKTVNTRDRLRHLASTGSLGLSSTTMAPHAGNAMASQYQRHKRSWSAGGRPAPGHRRTRSGDEAAATLMTGGADWIGMELDKLPLPDPVPRDSEDDDEDDAGGDEDGDEAAALAGERYDEVRQLPSQTVGSKGRGRAGSGGSGFGIFGSSRGGKSPRRKPSPKARQGQQRGSGVSPQSRSAAFSPSDTFALSDSTMDEDLPLPPGAASWIKGGNKAVTRGGQRPCLMRDQLGSSSSGVPGVVDGYQIHRSQDSMSTLGLRGVEQAFATGGGSKRSLVSAMTESESESIARRSSREEIMVAGMGAAAAATRNDGRSVSSASNADMSDSQESSQSAFSWISSRLSLLSGKAGFRTSSSGQIGTNMPRDSPMHARDRRLDRSTISGHSHSSSSSSPSSSSSSSLLGGIDDLLSCKSQRSSPTENGEGRALLAAEDGNNSSFVRYDEAPRRDEEDDDEEDTDEDLFRQRKTMQAYGTTHASSNGGRIPGVPSALRAIGRDSSTLSRPSFGVPEHEADLFPTFICPNCLTRQRNFFTVNSAPKQFESPAGYLAFYMAIYVVASLFIFGLEEGWPPLDCVYFAVITLTTAGLGDYVPSSDGAKIICSIFIYFGVACIGLLLGSLLASGLDDASRKRAKETMVNNCPNCANIETQKRFVTKNATAYSQRTPANISRKKPKRWATERSYDNSKSSRASAQLELAKPKHHYQDKTELNRDSSEGSGGRHSSGGSSRHSPSNSPGDSVGSISSRKGNDDKSHGNLGTLPENGQATQLGSLDETSGGDSLDVIDSNNWGENYGAAYAPTSPGGKTRELTPGISNYSPSPGEVLGRQTHTRHISFDLQNVAGVTPFPSFNSNRVRNYSVDEYQNKRSSPSMESSYANMATPAYNLASQMDDEGDSEDYSDTETSTGSYSSSSSEEDPLKPLSRVQAAKYVFLTLKQAVANSVFIIAIGGFGFYFIESMTAVDSFYFTTVLLTTVGYGDIVPQSSEGKMFATVYVLVAGTVLLHNMSMISMIPIELRKRRIERAVLRQFGDQLDDSALRELATGPLIKRLQLTVSRPDGLDECTREMFALAMLVRLGRISEQDVRSTFAAFRRLDIDNDGKLNSKDIIMGEVQRRQTLRKTQSQVNFEAAASTLVDTTQEKEYPLPVPPLYRPDDGLDATRSSPSPGTPSHEGSIELGNASGDINFGNNDDFAFAAQQGSSSTPYDQMQEAAFASEQASLLQHTPNSLPPRSANNGGGYMAVSSAEDTFGLGTPRDARVRVMSHDSRLSALTAGTNDVEMGYSDLDYQRGGASYPRSRQRRSLGSRGSTSDFV